MSEAAFFVLVAGAVAVTAVARRYGWPAHLLVLATGLAVSFVPAVPRIDVNPHLLLGLVLPPLLYSASLTSSYQDFRASLNSITRLGVGLVLVTAAAVAVVAAQLIPGLPLSAALVLGAVVAPPDAVAATAVGRRLGLPRRATTVLTGESLINDATSLTLYKVAIAAASTGATALTDGVGVFAVAVVAGVGVGLAVGFVVHLVRVHLDDAVVASTLGLLTPFAAYWGAEQLGGSGVLAVVAAGLYLGHTSPEAGYATRLYEGPIWSTFDMVLESFTFALIGVQLSWVVRDVVEADQGVRTAVVAAFGVLAATVVVRPLYVFATAWVDNVRLPGSHRPARDSLSARESAVVSWAGMRGVVTLAAAAAIPVTSGNGPFPARATLQLVAYGVAIGTLLMQGLSLPWMIRALGLGSGEDAAHDASQEAGLRVLTNRAAAATLRSRQDVLARSVGPEVAEQITSGLARAIEQRGRAVATALDPAVDSGPGRPAALEHGRRLQQLRRDTVAAQRVVLMRERDAGRVDEVVMRRMLRELDLEEEQLSSSWLNRV